jgi:hypothetical protein
MMLDKSSPIIYVQKVAMMYAGKRGVRYKFSKSTF